MGDKLFAYVIATTEVEALCAFRRWVDSGKTHSLQGQRMCFKGEADARYLLATHRQEDGPGTQLQIWRIRIEADLLDVAVSETGTPPYKDGDFIMVYDQEYGEQYRARVTDCLLAGARRPWIVHFESVNPVTPNDSRHHVGSLEAADDGTSPNIVPDN